MDYGSRSLEPPNKQQPPMQQPPMPPNPPGQVGQLQQPTNSSVGAGMPVSSQTSGANSGAAPAPPSNQQPIARPQGTGTRAPGVSVCL